MRASYVGAPAARPASRSRVKTAFRSFAVAGFAASLDWATAVMTARIRPARLAASYGRGTRPARGENEHEDREAAGRREGGGQVLWFTTVARVAGSCGVVNH